MDLTKTVALEDLPEVVQKLRNDFLAHGVMVVLAGGSIRDIYHGRECKDFDLILLGGRGTWLHDLQDANIAETILNQYGKVKVLQNYNENCNSRFSFCMKVEVDGVAIDVVEMLDHDGRRPKHIWEVFDLFDFNLNQFGINQYGVFCKTFDEEVGEIIPVREDCSEKRIAYLKSKYPQYKWPV